MESFIKMKVLIFFIITMCCASFIYYFFIKKGPEMPDFNLRDKKDNDLYDYEDQF